VREGPIVRLGFRPIRGAELYGISLVVLQTRFTADTDDGSGEMFSFCHKELQTHPLSGPISLRSGKPYSFQAELSALPSMTEMQKDDRGAPGDHPRVATGLQAEVRVLIARRLGPVKMAFWLMVPDSRR